MAATLHRGSSHRFSLCGGRSPCPVLPLSNPADTLPLPPLPTAGILQLPCGAPPSALTPPRATHCMADSRAGSTAADEHRARLRVQEESARRRPHTRRVRGEGEGMGEGRREVFGVPTFCWSLTAPAPPSPAVSVSSLVPTLASSKLTGGIPPPHASLPLPSCCSSLFPSPSPPTLTPSHGSQGSMSAPSLAASGVSMISGVSSSDNDAAESPVADVASAVEF